MVIHYLAALNKSLKTKETKIQKQIVKVLQQASDRRKKRGKYGIRIMKFLALTLYLLARLTKTSILASAIYWLFFKSQFSVVN